MRLQREYLPLANYEFKQEVDSFHFIPPEWRIVGVPCQRERSISKLNMAYDVGQIVKVSGQIIEISEKKTTFDIIAWKCKDVNCRQVHFVEQDQYLNTVSNQSLTVVSIKSNSLEKATVVILNTTLDCLHLCLTQ